MFRPSLIRRARTNLAVAVWLFSLLTVVRFVAEQIPPLWFPLLIAYAAVPLLTVVKDNWPRIGLQKPSSLWPVAAGIVAAILVKAGTIAILFGLLGTDSSNWMLGIAEFYQSMPSLPPAVIAISTFFMIAVPLAEEVFFRMFQSAWQTRFSPWRAVVVTALLFGFARMGEYLFPFSPGGILARLVPISIYGMIHAWVYHKTGSTYASMISHLTGNAAEALILVLFVLPGLLG